MRLRSSLLAMTCFLLAACGADIRPPSPRLPVPESTRLYALDCGRVELSDAGVLSESGKPIGRAATMVDPCFLVRHPSGILLWDAGLPLSAERQTKEGLADPIGREFVDTSLMAQLKTLSLPPEAISFVALSHLHYDHTGNANLFTSSTWLLNRNELAWALQTPTPGWVDLSTFSARAKVKLEQLDGDRDVFGDGTVRILATPGHTPGHQSLMVKLTHAGTIVLAGDLAQTRENWEKRVVPPFNDSRSKTLASMDRIRALLGETHGRLIVQHAPEDFRALPRFPAYLE